MDEVVQVAVRTNNLGTRTQPQVEGVAENDLGTHALEFLGGHRLDRAVGTDRHEGRCLDGAAGERQAHAPGSTVCVK